MQNGEIIPALIARIRQNNTDNVIIRSKLYNLLNNVTSKFNDVTKATPHIVDFQNMSNDKVLEHYYTIITSCYRKPSTPTDCPYHKFKNNNYNE